MRHLFGFAILAVACLAMAGPATAALVTNGGFETGDFTGWTLTNTVYDSVSGPTSYAGQGLNPDTGSYFALLGTPAPDQGGPVELSQVLATTSGQQYTFSFSFFAQAPGLSTFSAFWDGTQLLNVTNANSGSDGNGNVIWTPESFTVTGTGSDTIAIYSGDDPNYNGLDSVSVTPISSPTPEPGSIAVWGLGLAAAMLMARRRRAA